jgi:outer membrane protein assembly factor BamB
MDAPLGEDDLSPRNHDKPLIHRTREHKRRRLRRHGRRAYVRSVYFLPSMATLGNAICGFGAIYIAALDPGAHDPLTDWFYKYRFLAAAYMIFVAMLFDGLDGRLARFTRHTTDFGGQLDSLADVISFGAAPALIALQLFKSYHHDIIPGFSRLIWAVGALYMSCAAMRLARFNVSNEHGEQHHFSFLGLPSPGAAGAVAALVLMQQDLANDPWHGALPRIAEALSTILIYVLPVVVLASGLLMVSNIRYPHLINRYMKGRKSLARVITVVVLVLLLVVAHRYILGIGCLLYALWGPISWGWVRSRRRGIRALLLLFSIIPVTAFASEFKDPAPPVPSPLKTVAAPTASAQAELTFHNAPQPLAKGAVTSDSPGFLGTAHAPFSSETHLRADVKDLPIVWETEKGTGYAAPAVAEGRLILFHRLKDEEVVDCLEAETGKRFWRFAYASTYQDRYGYTSGPRCTPVIDTAHSLVVTYGAEGKLHALDLKTGQLVWERDILADFKLEPNFFGVGSTPLLDKDQLIINVGAKGACVVAFDVQTGKARWAAAAPKDWGPSYASPVSITLGNERRVLVFAGGESRPATGGLLCINPDSGVVDASLPWRGRRYESVNASAPLVVGDKVFISECYGKGGTLVQLVPGADNKYSFKTLWESEKLGTHFMTALPLDGFLYGCDGHGPDNCPLVCLDLATGDEKWRSEPDLTETMMRNGERKSLPLSTDRCHLLRVDGKTLCLTEWGHLLYLDLSPAGCKVASRTWLFASGETWSPPVLSHGLLYINQNAADGLTKKAPRLICYDLRGK